MTISTEQLQDNVLERIQQVLNAISQPTGFDYLNAYAKTLDSLALTYYSVRNNAGSYRRLSDQVSTLRENIITLLDQLSARAASGANGLQYIEAHSRLIMALNRVLLVIDDKDITVNF
jgi:hypothetical protein